MLIIPRGFPYPVRWYIVRRGNHRTLASIRKQMPRLAKQSPFSPLQFNALGVGEGIEAYLDFKVSPVHPRTRMPSLDLFVLNKRIEMLREDFDAVHPVVHWELQGGWPELVHFKFLSTYLVACRSPASGEGRWTIIRKLRTNALEGLRHSACQPAHNADKQQKYDCTNGRRDDLCQQSGSE